MDTASKVLELLATYGPWAVAVIVGGAYWHKDKVLTEERREHTKKMEELTEKLMKVITDKTAADLKLEKALEGLTKIVDVLTARLPIR